MNGDITTMCPPCKIISDDIGALAGSADYFASIAQTKSSDPRLVASARYLAHIATWSGKAIIFAIERGDVLTAEQIDEAHAMSELSCHRAAFLRDSDDFRNGAMAGMLMKWAEELRLHTTGLVGGEYKGAWIVDGVKGISKR